MFLLMILHLESRALAGKIPAFPEGVKELLLIRLLGENRGPEYL